MNRLALLLVPALAVGCAHNRISGTVVDRNGAPVAGAIVGLAPGNVEVVTDAEGRWAVDYLRDAAGERVRLDTRTAYEIEAFRVGYHVATATLEYKRGEAEAATITLVEDSIRVATPEDDIDPGREAGRPQAAGTAYEGE